MQYNFLNGSLAVGANNTVLMKVFFGHDVAYRTVQYTNTLMDLAIRGVEVSTDSLGLQYPAPTLFAAKEGADNPFYLGTLSYNATAEFDACKSVLCSLLPSPHAHDASFESLRAPPSASALQRRLEQKQQYFARQSEYVREELTWSQVRDITRSITTDAAGKIPVEVRIQPVVVNFFLDARHRTSGLLSKGLFTALTSLGFALDWHSAVQSRLSRRYHVVEGVQLDEELFFASYGEAGAEASRRQLADLQETKSRSIANGQYVNVQGHDVVFFANTVIGTERAMFLTLHNALEYPVLMRLTEVGDVLPEGLLPTNGSACIRVAAEAVREAVLAPNGHALLGPLLFRPNAEGTFSRHFAIMNNYTGVEVATVAGRSIQQPLLLRDAAGAMKAVVMDAGHDA